MVKWRLVSGTAVVKLSRPVRAAAGLVFRVGLKGYYALLVSPSTEHGRMLAFELVARNFGSGSSSYSESVIVPWTTIRKDSPSEAQLGIQVVGDQITILIDGKEAGVVCDDAFDERYEGFIVSAPARAVFSNFLLEQK